jgi:hypothetical protein
MSSSVLISAIRSRLALVCACALVLAACGGTPKPPRRGILESNVASWRFRRYQKLLDVEVWVPSNPAVGHTGTYVRKDAEREGRIAPETIASTFVTRYEHDRGILRALIEFVQRLENDAGYEVEIQSPAGVVVISITGQGESWALWYSHEHIVKVGGRGLESIPEELVEAYGERYPSRLTSDVLDRPLPPEDAPGARPGEEQAPYDPDNPTPDWESYQPGQASKPATASEPAAPAAKPAKASGRKKPRKK